MKRTFNCKLKDKTYELYFDNEALYEFETIHGSSAISLLSSGGLGFRAVTHLVYAGLLHLDDNPSLDKVKKLIPSKKFNSVVTSITQALEDALGENEEEEAEKNTKADQG